MSTAVLILGETGSGKSTSIRTLNPEETFIINTVGKPLPFAGSKKMYKPYDKVTKTGNMITITDGRKAANYSELIVKTFEWLDTRDEIKTVICDDIGYIMSYEFMDRAKEVGYGKYTDIASHMFNVVNAAKMMKDDKKVFVMAHIEQGVDVYENRIIKIKTIGKEICLYLSNSVKLLKIHLFKDNTEPSLSFC